jgi:hypothetical protein
MIMMKLQRLPLVVVFAALTLSSAFSQNPRTTEQGTSITNARVIEMSKLGLDDEIIIAKIKNGSCEFQLGDTDLVDLKKAGVSPKVIAAMLDSSVLTSPRVTINKREVPVHTMGQSKVGGRLGHDLTVGVKSVKEKAYLDGPHSTIVAGSSPVIEIDLPKGDTIDNYILVQMDGKSDRRELEVESRGGIVGGKNGIRAEAIRKTSVTPLGGNKFQLGADPLKKGEYIIYVVGSPDSIRGIYGRGYDFTVSSPQETPSTPTSTVAPVRANPSVAASSPSEPPAPMVVPDGSIGAFSDQEPRLRRDGILLSRVLPNGPADRAGIKAGDTILAIENHYLFTVEELVDEVRRYTPGAKVAVRYRRYSSIYETTVVVGPTK